MGCFYQVVFYMEFFLYACFSEETNIALHGDVRQSSIYYPEALVHGPEGGVDGDTYQDLLNGATCPHTIRGETIHWWAINFNQVYTIDHIRLYNREDGGQPYRLGNYYIHVYDSTIATWDDYDVTSGNLCYHHTDISPPVLTFGCLSNRAKFLKLTQNDPIVAGQPLTFCEIEIYIHMEEGYDGGHQAKRKFKLTSNRIAKHIMKEMIPTPSPNMCAGLCLETTGCIGFKLAAPSPCVLVQSATDGVVVDDMNFFEMC